MDTVKIGKFLKELRTENGLTQEQLGEKIGVTNKTVSRWENGNYLPPVECLELLSDIYQVSINELVAGQRLDTEEFSKKAEENLSDALAINEARYKKIEKALIITMIFTAIITVIIIDILPTDKEHLVRSITAIVLVWLLSLISSVVNMVAIGFNKERQTFPL